MIYSTLIIRVLIATIRDMGGCPCPRCTIPKEKIAGLGTRADQKIRVTHQRVDDEVRQSKVQQARDLVYTEGYVVTSQRVEEILKDESLVPTKVSPFCASECCSIIDCIVSRILSHQNCYASSSTSSQCS